MKNYLSNSFIINMVEDFEDFILIRSRKINPSEIPADVESAIGHADTARIVSGILGREVPAERKDVHLKRGDVLYVAQYKGPRLPEGATVLPEGARLEFLEFTFAEGCGNCPAWDCNTCGLNIWCHGGRL